MGRIHLVLLAATLAATVALIGCDAAMTPPDAGDSPDARELCGTAADCDDAVFCNGAERCAPADSAADARGCAPASTDACMPMQTCDEAGDECLTECDVEADADGDGAEARDCGGTDCDDANARRFPGAVEICDPDDEDEDCDSSTFGFRDADSDAHSDARCCNTDAEGASVCGGDCDDARPDIHPGLVESCDGADNDCDSTTDEGVLRTFFPDADGDSFGDESLPAMMACTPPALHSEIVGDCDDANAAAHPGTPEVCDGVVPPVDENCDGLANPASDCSCSAGATRPCPLLGVCGTGTQTCVSGAWSACPIMPSMELVGDGIDSDCNGAEICLADTDDDGYRTIATVASTDEDCDDPREARDTDPSADCDDADPARNPGAVELIGDGVDADCDGGEICHADGDNDGYRTSGTVTSVNSTCADLGEALATDPAGDCNDMNAAILPGAGELVGDQIDQNCDGVETCYLDDDDDGYRPGTGAATLASADTDCGETREALSSDPTGDCNDSSAAVRPGVAEITGDGIDQDCNGGEVCVADGDDDGYSGSGTTSSGDVDCADVGENLSTDPAGDCNDAIAAIRPGAVEIAGDQIDQNCDTDETCYLDNDDDGYRPGTGTATLPSTDTDCGDAREALSSEPTNDCNDSSVAIRPGVAEIAGDAIDQNCDGAETCFVDADMDGYRTSVTVASADTACATALGEALASQGLDCADTDAAISPGDVEICEPVDQDCDGNAFNTCPSAVETIGPPAYSTNFGGTTGGTLSTFQCPAGEVLVGIRFNENGLVRTLYAVCGGVVIAGVAGSPYYTYHLSVGVSGTMAPVYGDPPPSAGTFRNTMCPLDANGRQMVVTTIRGTVTGGLLESLDIQ